MVEYYVCQLPADPMTLSSFVVLNPEGKLELTPHRPPSMPFQDAAKLRAQAKEKLGQGIYICRAP
jgi:hypothetical protein